ncbi:MAG TPA: PAS domain S-box protein [Terriglobia bacterium]|nr:PAS domain S-box protein [Terriglobia bacterium]
MRFAVNRQLVAPPGAAPAWTRESLFREIGVQLTFLLVYLLLDRASTVFRTWAGNPAWYLPAGLSTAALLWGGLRYSPVFIVAAVGSWVFDNYRPLFSWAGLPGATATSVVGILGAVWLRDRWRLDLRLRSLRDVGGLALFLVLFAVPLALVGVLAKLGDGLVSRADFPKAVLNWWVGDSISVLSLTPFLLLYVAPRVGNFLQGGGVRQEDRESILRPLAPAEVLELVAELGSIVAALWLVLVFKPAAAYQPLYLLLLPVVWMAVRHGFARASLGVLAINVGVIAAAHLTRPDPEGLSRRQLVMLALALTGLCLGAVVGERRQAEDALSLSEEKFARAFHSSPAALSISTLSDGRLLEVNDTFLRLFEYERHEVIGKTSLELNFWVDPEERSRILDDLLEHGKVLNHERRHRSSSGRIFTVLSSMEIIEVHGVQRLLATFVDITQTKQAQQALQESEQRYRDFVTHSHEGVWRLELERPLPTDLPEQAVVDWLLNYGYIAECNLAFARISGFSSSEEVVGKRLRDVFPSPDSDVERIESIRSAARAGFRNRTVEFRAQYQGTEVRNLVRTEIPIVENGFLVRIWGITRDITERRRAEEARRESEERLRILSDNLPRGMVYQLDFGDGGRNKFTYVSAGVEELHEVTAEAVLQDAQVLYGQLVEEDRRVVAAREAEMVAHMTPFLAEVRCQLPSGRVQWSMIASAPRRTPDGRIICDGIELDVTERKRAEEARRESEERFRTTFENAGIGMAVVDLQGRLLQCNGALQTMLGYTDDELRRMAFTEFTHPDDRDLDMTLYQELIAGKRDKYEIEKRYVRKNGQVIWGHLTGSLVKDPEGVARYGVGMVEDITERKRAEDALRKLNAELEERVMERTQQLNLTNRELEVRNTELSASNQELEAFSYSVAHDLRAPLRQIQGFSHLLLESHGTDLVSEAHKYIRNIIDGSQHMGRLIDDLLDLSRLGRRALRLEVSSLAALVEDARRDLAREVDGRDVYWQIEDLPLVECDAALMRQVFVNLISNALKYTQGRQPALIQIGQTKLEGAPVVFVKDNGVGFNMKYADKLFGVFQRLHRREEFEGTGIGLATVKRIIEKHGGRVWAEAELEKGATFFFTLAGRWEGEPQEESGLTPRLMNAAANSS